MSNSFEQFAYEWFYRNTVIFVLQFLKEKSVDSTVFFCFSDSLLYVDHIYI